MQIEIICTFLRLHLDSINRLTTLSSGTARLSVHSWLLTNASVKDNQRKEVYLDREFKLALNWHPCKKNSTGKIIQTTEKNTIHFRTPYTTTMRQESTKRSQNGGRLKCATFRLEPTWLHCPHTQLHESVHIRTKVAAGAAWAQMLRGHLKDPQMSMQIQGPWLQGNSCEVCMVISRGMFECYQIKRSTLNSARNAGIFNS